MNTMTPMEADAFRQGQDAARCGWSESENEFKDEVRATAWADGFRQWLGITAPVAPARQQCETPELFLPA